MSWIILQTTGPRTLPLVRSLHKAGIDAWAPIANQRIRRPRSDKYRDVEIAVLPQFVFAPSADLALLLAAQHDPLSDHPAFSVFFHRGRPALVADEALRPLREFEERLRQEWSGMLEAIARDLKRKRKKTAARAYVMGQRVKVQRTAWSGLVGKIVEIKRTGDLVLVFDSFAQGATVPSCDVEPIHLSAEESERPRAA